MIDTWYHKNNVQIEEIKLSSASILANNLGMFNSTEIKVSALVVYFESNVEAECPPINAELRAW